MIEKEVNWLVILFDAHAAAFAAAKNNSDDYDYDDYDNDDDSTWPKFT